MPDYTARAVPEPPMGCSRNDYSDYLNAIGINQYRQLNVHQALRLAQWDGAFIVNVIREEIRAEVQAGLIDVGLATARMAMGPARSAQAQNSQPFKDEADQ